MATEKKKRLFWNLAILRETIPTITYNSNHTQYEDPEKESSCEPQEYQKYPTEKHGNCQATRGKKHKTNTGSNVLNII